MEDQHLHGSENRFWAPIQDMPNNLKNAFIAIEDKRFESHNGVDWITTVKSFFKFFTGGSGGGSTITQQLAKQLYTKVERSESKRMMQKPIEWLIAVQLERYYKKEEILTMYLNYFDFHYTGVGIKNAARTYFGKNTFELD